MRARSIVAAVVLFIASTAATSGVPASGRIIRVAAGGDVQSALDAASGGDVVELEAGATYRTALTLRAKPTTGWITVRSSAEAVLPPAGARVGLEHTSAMATIEAPSGPALTALAGAHHVRFVGIQFRPAPGVAPDTLILIGNGDRDEASLPHHFVFDRVVVRGDPARGGKRGLALNGRHVTVVGSHVADWKLVGQESQAIAGWNGSGPFAIVNSYVEGAGINLLFGGADPTVANLVPSDIEIRGNTFAKPLAWRVGDPAYAGTRFTVKNLLELKSAQRVVIDGNVFEHAWADAQTGFAIVFTVRNSDGGAPWSVVQDVAFTNNVVRHASSGMVVTGFDDAHRSRQTARVLVRNNLFDDVSGKRWGGDGRLFQILGGIADLTIERNTGFADGALILAANTANPRFTFRDNVVGHGEYGVIGDGVGMGRRALDAFFPGMTFTGNVVIGGAAPDYPAGNAFPASLTAVGFVDAAKGDFRLTPASRYRRAGSGGTAPGVDFDALAASLGSPWRGTSPGPLR